MMNDIRENSKDFSGNLEDRKSWLDLLPTVIVYAVLEKLDHRSLMRLARAYPQYVQLAINPRYWKNIIADINSKWLASADLLKIVKYLKDNVEYLALNVTGFDQHSLKEIFLQLNNIKTITLTSLNKNVVNYVCSGSFNNLKTIDIRYIHLDNEDFVQIANNFSHLKEFTFASEKEFQSGLNYFLEKVRCIHKIHLYSDYIDDKAIELLFKKHNKTLTDVVIRRQNDFIDEFCINNLQHCTNLKSLTLPSVNFTGKIQYFMERIPNVTNLSIGITHISEREYFDESNKFQKLSVVSFESRSSLVDDSLFNKFVYLFPNIQKLSLRGTRITDDGLENFLKNLNTLAVIIIDVGSQKLNELQFNFVKFINKDCYLPKLKELVCITKSSSLSETQQLFYKFENVSKIKTIKLKLIINQILYDVSKEINKIKVAEQKFNIAKAEIEKLLLDREFKKRSNENYKDLVLTLKKSKPSLS